MVCGEIRCSVLGYSVTPNRGCGQKLYPLFSILHFKKRSSVPAMLLFSFALLNCTSKAKVVLCHQNLIHDGISGPRLIFIYNGQCMAVARVKGMPQHTQKARLPAQLNVGNIFAIRFVS